VIYQGSNRLVIDREASMAADKSALGRDAELPGSRGRGEWAYERLHRALRDGEIRPGQRLLEVEIGAQLGLSRTPVREALHRMLAEGLLEAAVGGGFAVVSFELRAVAEFYAMRESMEGTAAAMAARNADSTEIAMLQASLATERSLADDARLHARQNELFHELIYGAAHNRFLLGSLRSLLNFVPLLGPTTYQASGRFEQARREHEDIVSAIAARDPARAEEATRAHIRSAYESRLLVLAEDVRRHPSRVGN
jgi:DNA-binding GntR family transcriptional regulator